MTFGREWVLWLVPAAFLLPAAVRLLFKPPRPEVRFGAMVVLREALADIRARRRYRPALALLLRCLGAASAAFAFSAPVADGFPLPLARAAAGAPSDVVFLLDRSYSMRAAYAGSDRFSLAAETAAAALGELGPEDRAALIFFDREPAGTPAWGRSPEELAGRALAASPGWETTAYRPALEAAFSLLSDGERPGARKSVLLLSDSSADGLAGMKEGLGSLKGYDPSFRVAGLDLSVRPANSWAVSVRRSGSGRALEAVAAWNEAAAASPPRRLLLCGPGGVPLPGPSLRGTGAASASAVFTADLSRGCVAAGPDALPGDDRAYYAFPAGDPSPGVAVLHPGPEEPAPGTAAYFMKKLFSSGSLPYAAAFRHYGAADAAVKSEAGTLVLAGLPPLSPATASALERWFDAGGAVVAFVSSSRPQSAELKAYFGLVSPGPAKEA
ncbi:MAG: VWA domain-containing protein, partial [Elusimicrobiales bacterium]|nr:VWA domain-containing protein [Elusimicrobiales bacterium]